MSNFTLKMDDGFGRSVETSFESEFLPEVLMNVDLFLRGCGYVIDAYDQLEYVPTEGQGHFNE